MFVHQMAETTRFLANIKRTLCYDDDHCVNGLNGSFTAHQHSVVISTYQRLCIQLGCHRDILTVLHSEFILAVQLL